MPRRQVPENLAVKFPVFKEPEMKTVRCPSCGAAMKRNGKTGAGSQRWRCGSCGASTTVSYDDTAARLEEFLAWLTSKGTQLSMPGQGRTFRRRTAEFWLFFTTTKFRISRLISFGFHRFAKVPHPFFANCPIFPSSRLPRTFCSARRTQPADHDA